MYTLLAKKMFMPIYRDEAHFWLKITKAKNSSVFVILDKCYMTVYITKICKPLRKKYLVSIEISQIHKKVRRWAEIFGLAEKK